MVTLSSLIVLALSLHILFELNVAFQLVPLHNSGARLAYDVYRTFTKVHLGCSADPSERVQRRIELVDYLPYGPKDYYTVWDQQKSFVEDKLAYLKNQDQGSSKDYLILVEHQPIYTLGTGSTPDHLKFEMDKPPPGLGIVRVERGGEVTYHGPGQLTIYPILDLRRWDQDLHWYLRQLEEVVIVALGKLGLEGYRVDGLTGVWVEGAKVAAIGVKVSRWITFHGIGLNVDPDMGHFGNIVPCGINDKPVCAVKNFRPSTTMQEAAACMVEAFEEVFQSTVSCPPSQV